MLCGYSFSHIPVPFWNENLRELNLQPLSTIDSKKSTSTLPSSIFANLAVAKCHVVKVPRFKSSFELYTPSGSLAYPTATAPIIPQDVADTEGRTFVAKLHFDKLGPKANLLRAVSKQYRKLYVGSLPGMQEKL